MAYLNPPYLLLFQRPPVRFTDLASEDYINGDSPNEVQRSLLITEGAAAPTSGPNEPINVHSANQILLVDFYEMAQTDPVFAEAWKKDRRASMPFGDPHFLRWVLLLLRNLSL